MPAAALCGCGFEPPSLGPSVTQSAIHIAWGRSASGCCRPGARPTATLRAHRPFPPVSLGERVRPVRRLQRDIELAAIACELVDRVAELGDVDRRRHLDLTQRVALRLLRGGSR